MKKSLIVTFLLIISSLLYADDITITGTVVSDGQKMIGSRYMGYIKKVYVKVGDHVKREDDLYEMESAEFDIMKSQADLMLEQSKIVVEFWRKRLENINKKRKRLEKRTKSKSLIGDLDDLKLQAENVKAMLESAQVLVKQASIKAKQMATIFNYLKMKAPSDGVITRRNIKVGDMVMPGMLTIMMVDTDDLEIHVSVSESIVAKVSVGQKLMVTIPSVKYNTIGTIKAIVPAANPMTHKIQMRITFDRGDKNIFPGMYAKVIIKDRK